MKIVRLIPNNNDLVAVRKRFGMSQQQLADHLGVSKSMVTLAERGKRDLGTQPLLKLAALEINYIAAPAAEPETEPPTPNEKLIARCRKELKLYKFRAMRCRSQYAVMQQKLEMLEERYRECCNLQRLLENLPWKNDKQIKKYTPNPWISQLEVVQEKLENCNPVIQAIMRVRIEYLRRETAINEECYQQILNELPNSFFNP